MQTILDYGFVILSWTVTVVRLALRRRGDATNNAWLHAAFFALFVTFQHDAVYIAFDQLVGINNLSWLMSYFFMALCAFYASQAFSLGNQRLQRLGLVICVGFLVAIFPFGPGSTPETLDHVSPGNIGELLFMAVMYTYAGATIWAILTGRCTQALRDDEPMIRLRTTVIVATLVVLECLLAIKFIAYSAGYWSLPDSYVHLITDASRIMSGAAIVLWFASFASNKVYVNLCRPIEFIRKALTLRKLISLRKHLESLSPSALMPRRTSLARLDLLIYQETIAILDGTRFLSEQLGHGKLVPVGAERLHQSLRGIPKSLSFDDLVAALCNIEICEM
jgi:hypothetical protein